MPQTDDSITRDQAIDLLRTAIRGMTDEETSMCKLAADRHIFCRGFARFDDEELRQCFDWIVQKQPAMSRSELEETANLWQLAAASLIRTGEALELFLLTITKHGLQYSFLNAPVQLNALRERVSTISRMQRPPQLIIRIGPGPVLTTTTPRRPVSEVLIPATTAS